MKLCLLLVKADVKPKDNDSYNFIDPKGWVLGKNRDQELLVNTPSAKSTTLY